MSQRDGLRDLQMSEPWHHGLGVLRSQRDNASLKPGQFRSAVIKFRSKIQSEIGGDLVIP